MSHFGVLYPHKVIRCTSIAPDVYILSIDAQYTFRAGQVIALDVMPNDAPRLYSIASGEQDHHLEILFDERPDGKITPLLSQLKTDDTVYISKPFGDFVCEKSEEAWWVAAGTGIAPFVSMLRSEQGNNKKLIHGGKSDINFYYSKIIEDVLSPESYIRCASRQQDTQYYNGRLTQWVVNQEFLPKGIKYYLCGSAEMVVDVRDLLIAKGVPFQQIISETYY